MITSGLSFEDIGDISFILPELSHTTQFFNINIISLTNKPSSQIKEIDCNGVMVSVRSLSLPKLGGGWKVLKALVLMFNIEFLKEAMVVLSNREGSFFKKVRMLAGIWSSATRIKNYINKNYDLSDYSALYSYWFDNRALACVMLKKQYPHLKIVTRAHGGDLYKNANPARYQPAKLYMDKNIDMIAFVSRHGLEYYRTHFSGPGTKKCNLFHLGVKKNMEPSEISYAKRGYVKALSISNLVPVKRIHLLIEALSGLEIEIEWTHFGSGPEDEALREMAHNRLDEKNNIKYRFAGFLENTVMIELIKEMRPDFLINVSASEGLPVSMMEACSLSLPIIGTAVGGVPEIVGTDNGILLSPNPSAEEIRFAIVAMSEKTEMEMMMLKKNSYIKWRDEFDSEKNYKKFAERLDNL